VSRGWACCECQIRSTSKASPWNCIRIRYFLSPLRGIGIHACRGALPCRTVLATRAIKALVAGIGRRAVSSRTRQHAFVPKLGRRVRPFLDQAYGHVEGARNGAGLRARADRTLRLGLMSTVAPSRLCELVAALRASAIRASLCRFTDATAQRCRNACLAAIRQRRFTRCRRSRATQRVSVLPLYREPFSLR